MKIKVDEEIFDKLAEVLKRHDLNEVEYKDNDVKIRLTRGAVVRESIEQKLEEQTKGETVEPDVKLEKLDQDKTEDWDEHEGAIKSPMVGTCYLAPEPGAQNFVAIGDIVQKDQPLLIIEAMKVMNLIKSPRDGKVVCIAVSNAEPVEYDQLLVVIE